LGTYIAGSETENRILKSAEVYAELARASAEEAKATALGRIADAIEKFSDLDKNSERN